MSISTVIMKDIVEITVVGVSSPYTMYMERGREGNIIAAFGGIVMCRIDDGVSLIPPPCIVIHQEILDTLSPSEVQFIIGHECHHMLRHDTYRLLTLTNMIAELWKEITCDLAGTRSSSARDGVKALAKLTRFARDNRTPIVTPLLLGRVLILASIAMANKLFSYTRTRSH